MRKAPRTAGWIILLALVTAAWGSGPAWAAEATIQASTSLTLDGLVTTPRTFDLEQLKAEPATTATVFYSTSGGPVTATFKGALLWTLLQEAGIKTDPAVRNENLRRSLLVTATDGYQALLSLGEISPNFGGEPAMLAYEQDGKPLASGGFARLIVPGDKAGGRNVSSVTRIEVR